MFKILKVLTRVIDVIMTDSEKKRKYAIENILFMAVAVVCAWGAKELIEYLSVNLSQEGGCTTAGAGYIFLAGAGTLVCVFTGAYTLIAGVLSQAVLVVFCLLRSLIGANKAKNFITFIIALLSLVVVAVGALILFKVIQF